jgi:hypothetical protein
MILITKDQRAALDKVGLLQYKRVGINAQDQNFVVVNKEHMSRDKSYYVVESPEVMLFLGRYENLNLQKIRNDQLKTLQENKMLHDGNMQKWGTYVPNALAFEDEEGQWRIKKVTNLMLALNIWKSNKK